MVVGPGDQSGRRALRDGQERPRKGLLLLLLLLLLLHVACIGHGRELLWVYVDNCKQAEVNGLTVQRTISC